MKVAIFLMLLGVPAMVPVLQAAPPESWQVEEEVELGHVPAEFPVGFCLLSTPERQYVAYYDAQRRMTVAARKPGESNWERKVLPTQVGWDSHNYITMAVDADGQLHVSGNMHCVPLIYFRTARPGEIASLEAHPMTGELENKATYPQFLKDAQGRLLFTYRHGSSGNGINIWNRYDPAAKAWSRLLNTPLLDGQGKTNAYPKLPVRHGEYFHMIWVWRDTPDCATNHHLSYARSRDMVHWESAFGDKVALPITIARKELWVDPAPAGSGMINGGQRLFFDSKGRPLIVYHRENDKGHMQIYAARVVDGKWRSHPLTDWKESVKFSGGGSMPFIGISMGQVERVDEGVLSIGYRHKNHGLGMLVFDEHSLKPIHRAAPPKAREPAALRRVRGDFEGLTVRRADDSGSTGEKGVRYVLTWETLGSNHDKPRKPPLPKPSTLKLYKLRLAQP